MGADQWSDTGQYQPDIAAAFHSEQVAALEQSSFPSSGRTIAELWEDPEWVEHIFAGGTASVLDFFDFEAASTEDRAGVMRLISDDEIRAWCPSGRPTRTEWVDADRSGSLPYPDRAEGRCTVLYRDGQPAEIAYWGVTAD